MTKLQRMAGLVVTAFFSWISPADANAVTDWHALAVQCISTGVTGIPASRPGPPGMLDLALVQAAVHDAVQAIEGDISRTWQRRL